MVALTIVGVGFVARPSVVELSIVLVVLYTLDPLIVREHNFSICCRIGCGGSIPQSIRPTGL